MTQKPKTLRSELVRFHRDEEGLEALQVVMIVAVASIMLLFVKKNWESIKEWFKGLMDQVTGWKE